MVSPCARLRSSIVTTVAVFAAVWLTVAAADETSVATLIHDRLALMQDVAAFKYLNGIPVEDLERETVVLSHAIAQATDAGLDGEAMAPFFAAQIEAAKEIQFCWIDRWTSGTAPAPNQAPDLTTHIRPRLIEIGAAIVAQIATTATENDGAAAAPLPATDCLSLESSGLLVEKLAAVIASEE